MTKKQREVLLKEEEVIVTRVADVDPGAWLKDLSKSINVKVVKQYGNYLEFDLIGCDTSLANALRRIIIAEVPTMAIETVYMVKNTTVIQDEVLCHRLGLIPIYADPRKFDFWQVGSDSTDINTIVFQVSVRCSVNPSAAPDETDPKKRFINSSVYTDVFEWIPQGAQETSLAGQLPRPYHNDILLAKMRPGQELEFEVYCIKGVGKEHAKWSPVSCATYRLMPKIEILQPIVGEEAKKFANCFAPGVIELVPQKKGSSVLEARVADARYDTMSREVLRHPEFRDKVELKRVPDHFIFQVESVGFYQPPDIVIEAIKILKEKATRLRACL